MSKGLLGGALVILGVLLVVFGFYTSFEVYVKDKLMKTSESVGYFVIKTMQGNTSVNLPDRSSVLVMLKTPEEKMYATQNINLPRDEGMYYIYQKNLDGYSFTIYTKSINVSEYLEYVLNNPFTIGISFAGVILILIGIYTNVTQPAAVQIEPKVKGESETVSQKTQHRDDQLINHLKALRLTIATSKIIPEESLEKTKDIIDSILKSKGGKG